MLATSTFAILLCMHTRYELHIQRSCACNVDTDIDININIATRCIRGGFMVKAVLVFRHPGITEQGQVQSVGYSDAWQTFT